MRRKSLICFLIFFFLFSQALLLTHLKHECSHDDSCPICFVLNHFFQKIKNSSNALFFIILEFSFFVSRIIDTDWYFDNRKDSLIGLRVKLTS
ncbi:MAG: hypothetical protein IJ193_05525 [Bacilli bacterium]|nr:hypothetical protein [Bacilli bacterium]